MHIWQKCRRFSIMGTMAGKTVNRAELYQAVYQKVGLSRTECATLLELVLKEITDCLERGETVKLSRFGSFVVRKKGQRMGRNPRTGEARADLAPSRRNVQALRDPQAADQCACTRPLNEEYRPPVLACGCLKSVARGRKTLTFFSR